MSEWSKLPIRDLALKITKGTTPSKKDGGFSDYGINYIKSESVSYDGSIDTTKFTFITEDVHEKLGRSKLQEDDILFSMAGVNLGKVGLVDKRHLPANTNQALALIRPNKKLIYPKFLLYSLQKPEVYHFANNATSQSAQPNINLKDIGSIEVSLPDLETQIDIADKIDVLTSKILLNRQINQTLEEMAQAIFKSWFVDFEPVKAKIKVKQAGGNAEQSQTAAMCAISGKTEQQLKNLPEETLTQLKTTANLFPEAMQESVLGEIPESFFIGEFQDVCRTVQSGGTPKRSNKDYWDGDIKWLSSGEVRDVIVLDTKEKISSEGLKNSSAKLWPKNTTVIAMYGATAGQVCLLAEEMTANQACCALIPKKEYTSFNFLAARNSVSSLSEKASGSAQQNLNKGLISRHEIVIPGEELAMRFEEFTRSLLKKWIENDRESKRIEVLRETLLPKLLSGKLI